MCRMQCDDPRRRRHFTCIVGSLTGRRPVRDDISYLDTRLLAVAAPARGMASSAGTGTRTGTGTVAYRGTTRAGWRSAEASETTAGSGRGELRSSVHLNRTRFRHVVVEALQISKRAASNPHAR